MAVVFSVVLGVGFTGFRIVGANDATEIEVINTGDINEGGYLSDIPNLTETTLQRAQLWISTEPEGADIYIGNDFIGTSPIDVLVDMGVHTVKAQMDGYIPLTFPMSVDFNPHNFFSGAWRST